MSLLPVFILAEMKNECGYVVLYFQFALIHIESVHALSTQRILLTIHQPQ